ncbi:hypothetical protein ACIP98_36375 [Streptomyces sp. NPDC088354]|uniref:hypothetical protein n=1 Tax=Streptomyces sp. NPDC088354 TaxID=3365856 RepID=UPI00382D08D7
MATLLQVLISQRGWSNYATFRRHYTRAARELADELREPSLASVDVSESTYERWRTGRAKPQTDARQVLEHQFKRSIGDLLAEAGFDCETRQQPEDHSAADQLCRGEAADLLMMGRHAMAAARRAMEFAMGAENNTVGAETLAYLQDEVRRLAGLYTRVPLGTILDDLTDIQDRTFRLLESGRAKPAQHRDLYLLAAVLSGMLAKASHDLRDPRSAMMQARTAAVCAEQADHTAMSAWVLGLQSLISYWANRPEDALHYARKGSVVGTDATGSVGVWLASLEARAAGVLGDAATVDAATHLATTLRDRTAADDLDALGGNFVFPTVRQDYYAVEAQVLLGQGNHDLLRQAEDAVGGYANPDDPHWAFGDEAGARSNLALARLYLRDLEGASEAVHPVLDLPAAQRNAGIIGSIERVRVSLTTGPVREAVVARELREEITAFASRPALALPR